MKPANLKEKGAAFAGQVTTLWSSLMLKLRTVREAEPLPAPPKDPQKDSDEKASAPSSDTAVTAPEQAAPAKPEAAVPPSEVPQRPRLKVELSRVQISPEAIGKRNQKKLLGYGGLAVLVVFGGAMLMNLRGHKDDAPAPKKDERGIELVPPNVVKESFEVRAQRQILSLEQDQRDQHDRSREMKDQIEALRKQQSDDTNTIQRALDHLQQTLPSRGNTTVVPPPSPNPPGGEGNAKAMGAASSPPPEQVSPPEVPAVPPAEEDPLVIKPEAAAVPAPAADKSDHKVGVHRQEQDNKYAGYIPAGSFALVDLLTGIEAGTAASSQGDPQPVLMRVEANAFLPAARYQIASCFALGSSYASLSTERAYIRLVSLSCVDRANHLLIDSPIKGYVADSDGMFGLRGTIVQRQGALLAKSLLAGFASGLSNALGQAQGTVYSGTSGAGSVFSGSDVLKGSAFGGASNAANQLASFYLKEAEAIFPVIEVPPRRKATIVITDGASLRWADYQNLFVEQIKPESKQ